MQTHHVLLVLAVAAPALLVARAITPLERRLVTGSALMFGGIFLAANPGADAVLRGVGVVGWLFGLAAFLRAGVAWRREAASRAGPWAAVLLLPPAFLGALVLLGLLAALLPDTLRAALRGVGG